MPLAFKLTATILQMKITTLLAYCPLVAIAILFAYENLNQST